MPHPALREELALFAGPRLADGQPSWTLHDPVRNQFFRIDWLTFEILSRWHLAAQEAVVEEIQQHTPLRPEVADVEAVTAFLKEKQLVQMTGAVSARTLAEQHSRMRGSWATWLLHHYLFFRIPLIRPDAWLSRWVGAVAPLYSRTFAGLTVLVLALGGILIFRDWDRFSTTLMDTFSWEGAVGFGVTLAAVKVLHEMAHAFTAKRYGCRVPVMGLAFLILIPMAYTDTNEVWKLSSRRQRLAVAAAGVTAELVVAIWASLAWALLPEGLPKSMAFMLCTTTWVATLAINASPFMRFDGYFLLSDWLDMPNLHSRSFALARWDLRERLLGLHAPPPEHFSPRRTAGLIVFAYATWLYRLVLFLGIAALVYGFFIKALGIVLFVVEIGWFVVLPVWGEIKLWPNLLRRNPTPSSGSRSIMKNLHALWRHGPRVRRTILIGLGLVILLLVPLPKRISSKGLLKPADVYPIHAPAGAQVTKMPWREGDRLDAGDMILELASPELKLRWNRAQTRLTQQRQRSNHAAVTPDQRQNLQVLQQEQNRALAELASVETEMTRYAPKAPFAGVLRQVDPDLKPGTWVAEHERLAVLINRDGLWRVETYLDENDVARIKVGDTARFYADGVEGPVVLLRVSDIEIDATRILQSAQLASQFGGSVLTRERRGQLVPERAVYRVVLGSQSDLGSLSCQSWRGNVVIHGAWEAPSLAFLRAALALVWREVGF